MNNSPGLPAGEPPTSDGLNPNVSPSAAPERAKVEDMDDPADNSTSNEPPNPYDLTFWNIYVANLIFSVAVSILYRYSDFVHFLRGSEMELGLIVGVGMTGALGMRLIQGIGIDRFGSRRIWLFSLTFFVISALSHVWVTRIDTPTVYLLRMLLTISTAGAFGSSITFVSLRSPETRLAEMIGVLGSSGFIGMALGPTIGDWLLATGEMTRVRIDRMFYLSAIGAALSFVLIAMATRHIPLRAVRRQPPLLWILKRYHPGPLLLVAFAMGLGLGLPNVFLQPYAAELDIPRIEVFFWIYSGAAFAVRVFARRWTDRIGARPVALVGLVTLSASMLLYLVVWSEWSLALPAVFSGLAHALLFPAVMSSGSVAFPTRYRGLATTVMLAMFDLGSVIGQPAIGGIVHASRKMGWPPYGVMFVIVSIFIGAVAVLYVLMTRPATTNAADDASPKMEPRRDPEGLAAALRSYE